MALQPAFITSAPLFLVPVITPVGQTEPSLDTGHRTFYNIVRDHLRGREFDQTTESGFKFP
jgi:hypothetical protein